MIWLSGIVVRQLAPDVLVSATNLVVAAIPPLLIAILVVSLARGIRPQEFAEMDERLGSTQAAAVALHALLQSVAATLLDCVEQTERLARTASDKGDGLAASATLLSKSANDVVVAGSQADAAATRLIASLPDIERLSGQITTMGGRLGTETAQQLEMIDALLRSVQVRGDEVATQADVAIASINKQLAEIDEQSRQTTSRIAKRAYALDAAVDGATGRAAALLDSIGETIAARMTAVDERLAIARTGLLAVGEQGETVIGGRLDQLLAAGNRLTEMFHALDEQSATLRDATDVHLDTLPGRLASVRHAGSDTFDHLTGIAGAFDKVLNNLEAPLAASDATLNNLREQMDGLGRVADHFQAGLASGLPTATEQLHALEAGAKALNDEIETARTTLASGAASTRAIALLVGETRVELAALGDADLRLVDDRMNATATIMRDIGRQIAAYGTLSGQTKAVIESDVEDLGRRFQTIQNDAETRLLGLSRHIAEVTETIAGLTVPIGLARTLVGDVDAEVDRVGDSAEVLAEQLTTSFTRTASTFAVLQEHADALLGQTSALEVATARGSLAIADVSHRFADERAAFADAAATLGAEFDRVRGVLEALEVSTARVSAGTADELGRTFERARQLAEANAAALREMLAAVVSEAEVALGQSGAAVAEAAFGEPIRREVAAIGHAADRAGDIAEAAARRVAGQAKAIEVVIGEVKTKVDEIETRLDIRARDTLSARSSRLIEMLGTASVDVTRLLAIDAGEKAWVRYLKGDRSIFARHAVRLVDRQTSQKIARHFAHDAEFKAEASHYLDLFEKLSRRLMTDPDGDALLATVVSSDIGKLYVAIARATERWSPFA